MLLFSRKRYDKAETEYVAAKLDLQKKTEVKEQLTEHLCTIIQQNELRKAKKLEELMQQLEVEADEETLELEIEVEQMLQQQEGEAAKPGAPSQTLAAICMENAAPQDSSKGHEDKEPKAEVSEQLLAQPTNSHPSNQGQTVSLPSGEIMAPCGT